MLSGSITFWSGSIGAIPTGWFLCDGENGTPDLTSRFIIGAGNSYNPDDSGGAFPHVHTFTGDGHYHDLKAGFAISAGFPLEDQTGPQNITGTSGVQISIPPYFALAFIMLGY